MRAHARLGSLLAVACLIGSLCAARATRAAEDDFPTPAGMETAVAFWMRVYLEVTTQAGLLHDARHLGVVYEPLRFDSTNPRVRQRVVDARRRHWHAVLRGMAAGQPPRNAEEETILRLFQLELGHTPTPADLRRAATQIRFQLGQRDKFRDGIMRSGAYEQVMRAMFREQGLPEDLAFLPHVESSFNLKAYSKYGAAGVWQFMRSTGRRFMRVDYIVDERLDPLVATRAATRLLKENYGALDSWPLAVTAYNHGVAGMKRAKRSVGTDHLPIIIRAYHSRTFGFASRNFYAQFLAARKIAKSHETYFGPLRRDEPEVVDEITLPFYVDVRDLHRHLGVPPEVVQRYNLALRPPVFQSGKRIPRGYVLRLPAGTASGSPTQWLAALPNGSHHTAQKQSSYYTVRRGDSLSRIASRHGTSVQRLVALNNLSSRHRIYAGQTLQLPESGAAYESTPTNLVLVRTANAATKAPPKPEPKPAPRVDPIPEPTPEPKAEPEPAPTPTPERTASTEASAVDGVRYPLAEDSPYRRVDVNAILVDTAETMGHYAEWLEVPAARLYRLNNLARARKLHYGQRLRLDFSRVDAATFLQRRVEYHKGIEEDFFGSYSVSGTKDHTLRRGDNLWRLAHRTYKVPSWLIQSYNRELDLTTLKPGQTIKIPVVEPVSSSPVAPVLSGPVSDGQ